MSLFLLTIEQTAFWLFATAWATAGSVRVRHAAWRWLIALAALAPLAMATAMTAALWRLAKGNATITFPLEFATIAMVLTLFAAVAVIGRGWSRDGGGSRRAESWRMGALAIAAGAILLAHGMTFWNADLSMRQRIETLRVEAGAAASSLAPVSVPEPQNAAVVYQETMLLTQTGSPNKELDEWTTTAGENPAQLPVEDPQLLTYLKRRSEQLQRVREATQRPVCNFRRDWARLSVEMLLPETQALRGIAQDLRLSAYVAVAQGRRADALRDVVAMHRLADHASQEPILVSLLVATAIDHIAVRSLEHVLLRGAGKWTAEDLQPLDDWHAPPIRMRFQTALRMEEAFGTATFCQILNGDTDARVLESVPSNVNFLGGPAAPFYRLFFMSEEVRSYRNLMRQAQNRVLATGVTAAENERWFQAEFDASRLGLLSRLMLPALASVFKAMNRSEAMQRLATLAIALARHRQQYGAYPESLEAWDSNTMVPHDPFVNAPLRMIRRDDRLVLYSVGPDAVDNQAAGDDLKFELPAP
ncbi:MAG: hypothetical protein U0939_07295 [Pirellulales bacterium]